MKRVFTIVGAVLCLAFVACGGGRTPQSATKAFFTAIEQGEFIEALHHTTFGDEGDTELYCAIMEKERKSIAEKGGIEKIEIVGEEVSAEDENIITATTMITYGNGTTHEEYCKMVKIENRWKIDVNLDSK